MTQVPRTSTEYATHAKAVAATVYVSGWALDLGISLAQFEAILAEVAVKYCSDMSDADSKTLLSGLRHEELALARGCCAGYEKAWEIFLTRFRSSLYEAAYSITRNDAAGRELADSLYADLYGTEERNGRRRSKLRHYMGRGSLEGWLRSVLAQEWITRKRRTQREVSLDEQVETGKQFTAEQQGQSAPNCSLDSAVAAALAGLSAEERFLLAAYFLDGRTLAQIALVQRVHESTISRKLDRLTTSLRKEIRRHLIAAGLSPGAADEALQDVDVRDLNVKVRENLKQESPPTAF